MIGQTIEYLNGDKSQYIRIVMKNAITLELSGEYSVTRELGTALDGISELCINELLFTVGDLYIFTINGITYKQKIYEITKSKVSNKYTIIVGDRNKSRFFVLPTLGKDGNYYSIDKYFVNSFMTKNNDNSYANFYLVYRSSKANDYIELESKLQSHSCFVDAFDFNDTDLLIEFKIPEAYIPEVEKFVAGKYSKFTPGFKDIVLNFWKPYKATNFLNLLNGVFNKDIKIYKDLYGDMGIDEETIEISEVYSKPDPVKENINYV